VGTIYRTAVKKTPQTFTGLRRFFMFQPFSRPNAGGSPARQNCH
jgi:hypothetical protein